MSNYETKAGQGSLFENTNKTEEKHPDYKGKLVAPDGQTLSVSGWKKTSKAGNEYLSLSCQPWIEKTS